MTVKDCWRRRRIGVDLDRPSQLKLLKSFFNASHFFPDTKIEVLETGHGYHIKIWRNHELQDNFTVRMCLGDDQMRLEADEFRVRLGLNHWTDTLFSFKKQDGKVTREQQCNFLAEPFWSRMPCRKPMLNRSRTTTRLLRVHRPIQSFPIKSCCTKPLQPSKNANCQN